jgi:hypothetical protein
MVQARLGRCPFKEAGGLFSRKSDREGNGERENKTKAAFEGERKYHELT